MGQTIAFDVLARDKASSTFSRIGRTSESTAKRLMKFTKLAGGAFAGVGVVSFLKGMNAEAREAQKVGALTTQVIKSTGGAAKVTSDHVEGLATALSNKVGIDDEAIQSGENLLLTFKNISNEAGKHNKIFDQATKAALDLGAGLAAASGGEVNFRSATTLVGKALNDPIKGLTALRRVGVDFTKGQQDQIKKLVESGQRMKAQKIILRELKSEFGGAAASQATAGDKARVAWENLQEQLGTALLPTVDRLARFTTNELIPAVSKFATQMQTGTGAGGEFVDVLKATAAAGKSVLSFFNGLPGPVKKYGVEILLAAVAMRKLNAFTAPLGASLTSSIAKTKQFAAEMTYTATRTQRVTAASQAMGGMLRNAAGAGGMVLLADSAGRTGTKLGLLESAAGGALSGAALGAFAGPQGAAAGAAIGGLGAAALSLMKHTKDAGEAARTALGKYRDYAATLDTVTGATTAATRAMVQQKLEHAKVLDSTRALGIADRTVVTAMVTGGKAREWVIATLTRERTALDAAVKAKETELSMNLAQRGDLRRQSADRAKSFEAAMKSKKELEVLKDLRDARGKDIAATLRGLGAVDKSVAATRRAIAASKDYGHSLDALPAAKRTKVEATGIIPTIAGISRVAARIGATPSEVAVLMKAAGVTPTQAAIQKVINKANEYARLHPNPRIDANTQPARTKVASLVSYMNQLLAGHFTASVNIAAGGGGGSKGGGGKGKSSDRLAADSGTRLGAAFSDGMRTSKSNPVLTVRKWLDRMNNELGRAKDRLSNLRDLREQFTSTFTADSIFGADLETTGKSLTGLLSFSQTQASRAAQLAADVQRVAQMGLSKSLIEQLRQQGSSGADQLHLLAGGSADQIRQFNALNAQTQASLATAGMTAGNAGRGGSIDADIAKEKREDERLERIIKKLRKLDDDKYVVVQLDSEKIILAVKKRNSRKGVKTAGM